MSKYLRAFSRRATPQTLPILGSTQTPDNAGGYAWAIDDWGRLDRFLVLGSEGGTYYVGEHKLTRENAEAVLRCIQADGLRVVQRIVEVSEAGRAPKQDPGIFALALCSAFGDAATKAAAHRALPRPSTEAACRSASERRRNYEQVPSRVLAPGDPADPADPRLDPGAR